MTLRFQADVNLNELILRAACRREPALVFHTAAAASLGGLPDPKVLERAADEGCILVTHDRQTHKPCHDLLDISGAFRRLYPVGTNSKSMSCWTGNGRQAGRLNGWGR